MGNEVGNRVRALRERHGLTQAKLAEAAQVEWRTLQRIEQGDSHNPRPSTLEKLARALGVDQSRLRFGFSAETLAQFEESSLCPHCGALIEQRVYVPNEYGEDEVEVFQCGHMRGVVTRPCPKDPLFPKFEEYELSPATEDPEGTWYCIARGTTDAARQLTLDVGFGSSKAAAELAVKRSYLCARDGCEAAEREIPLMSILAE